jgi:conjugative transfer signal peptidase TraF
MIGPIAWPATSLRMRPSARPGEWALALGALALAAASALSGGRSERLFLVNTTASEPLGVYRRTDRAPEVGRLIAFGAPPAAFPYADRHLGYLHRAPLLKTVVGVAGDRICTTRGRLVVNGRDLAPIVRADEEGRALPHWIGCRRLGPGELFVFSSRAPDSFDSRYFGPVPSALVRGVYAPLLTAGAGR